MASDDSEGTERLSRDDAFAVLANETRLQLLRTLGEAGESLSFSELRDRVGMRDSGKFNYHFDRLVGHFVANTVEGYALHQSGRHVVQTILFQDGDRRTRPDRRRGNERRRRKAERGGSMTPERHEESDGHAIPRGAKR